MSLSDIMGNLRLDVYAEVAIVLFFLAFAAVAARALRRPRQETSRMACLPLDDGGVPSVGVSEPSLADRSTR